MTDRHTTRDDHGTSQVLRLSLLIALMLAIAPMTGCRICSDCEDLDYAAYGGAWQRTLRDRGRVGSAFDPAGAKAAMLVDRDTPEGQADIQRQQQSDRDKDVDNSGDVDDTEDPKESPDDEDTFRDRAKDLRDQELDDIESDREDELRKKGLDDIEVRIIQGRPPLMVNTDD
ncbi:hypothetical protein [Rubripirellula amarantea]|nr:hypothetical protein [Rubripirellula amarantea]